MIPDTLGARWDLASDSERICVICVICGFPTTP